MAKLTKNECRKKDMRKTLTSIFIKILMFLSAFSILKIHEALFVCIVGFYIFIGTLGIILLIAFGALSKNKDLSTLLFKEQKTPIWSKNSFCIMYSYLSMILNVSLIVLKLLGYISFSWTLINMLAVSVILRIIISVYTNILLYLRWTSPKELVILSFSHEDGYKNLVNEYLDVKNSMRMFGSFRDKLFRKELAEVRNYYYDLIRS